MPNARIGGEHLVVFVRPHKDGLGVREALQGGGEHHARDGDIGAQGDAREHVDAARASANHARAPHALVTRHQRFGVAFAGGIRNRLREKARVDVAQAGSKRSAKPSTRMPNSA